MKDFKLFFYILCVECGGLDCCLLKILKKLLPSRKSLIILFFICMPLSANDLYIEVSREGMTNGAMLTMYAYIKKAVKETCVEKGFSNYRITEIKYIGSTDKIFFKCFK